MDQIPCPDGYLLEASSPLAEGHHALNQYLVRVEEAGWQAAIKEVNAIRIRPRKLVIWKALLERMAWLRDHNRQSACVSPMRGLAERVGKWTLDITEADLLDVLDRAAEAADFLAPYSPMPHLMEYVERHGLTPELSARIRKFRDCTYDRGLVVNQTSLQLFRSRLDMLAWRDETTPVDLKRCWSERIRQDFRAMQGGERESWQKLIHSIHGDEGTRPTQRWLETAGKNIQALGLDAFCTTLEFWFAPLTAGSTHKLSREGSHILRALIWLAKSTKNPALSRQLENISEVEFKPKANGQKVICAAAEACGQPDPTVGPSSPPPDFHALAGRALATVFAPTNHLFTPELSGRVQVSGDYVRVQGNLDSYRVHIATGEVVRESDGKRIEFATEPAKLIPGPLPDLGAITHLMSRVMFLIRDAEHPQSLKVRED